MTSDGQPLPNQAGRSAEVLLGQVPRHEIIGIKVSAPTMVQLFELVEAALDARRGMTVTFLNPNYAVATKRDRELRDLIGMFDLDLVDGWGIALAARCLGARIPERLANDDIGARLWALLAARQSRVFLFGSAPGVADAAAETLRREFSGIQIVGTQHGWVDVERGHPGYFEPADLESIADRISATRADFVLVGIPTPHQQRFVIAYGDRLGPALVMTGGSYLDHLTEQVEWYPGWVKRMRVCWLYRLVQEPRRLWYRYTVELAQLGWEVLRYAVFQRKSTRGLA